MGPLVPGLIDNELNLIVALLLGIAFGFVLEQAGFSSSRKLAGLFYGYDFVVLRVFFTAGITAMAGVIALSWLGWLNLDQIYINPMFFWSAIVGGVIMGAGFITGGFCPGTSVCAAATGKIDAMFFISGIFLGVFAFGEVYPAVEGLYNGSNYGNMLINDVFGISRGAFALIMILVAVGAFLMTTAIENHVTCRGGSVLGKNSRRSLAAVGIAVVVAVVLLFLPDYKTRAVAAVGKLEPSSLESQVNLMPIEELAVKLMSRDRSMQLVDVRSPEAFTMDHLPGAINIPYDSLSLPIWRSILRASGKTNVFYGSEELTPSRAALLSKRLKDNPQSRVLAEGFERFKAELIDFSPDSTLDPDKLQFRVRAKEQLAILKEEANRAPVTVEKPGKVRGGC